MATGKQAAAEYTKSSDATGVLRRATEVFGQLEIAYDARVLTPRDWTIAQSSWAAEILLQAPAGDVLELCCGAGHIGLQSVLRSRRRLVCVDLNPVAIAYALENAKAAGMCNRVELREGRITDVLRSDEQFPLIIADPPWVPRAELARYSEAPLLAIDGGVSGMTVIAECVAVIERHLSAGGSALLQVGTHLHVDAVRELLTPHSGVRAGETRAYSEPECGHLGVLLRLDRA